ncbi:MAG: serine/threonine protein kinase [Gammaproteobacteria bacterium]|nr:serine/threonine protein kinase [Gammaproteobacteria bacterium]MCW9005946.1 serine/threonine protein kinase [Gammaproteobacteria bacterium]MCW9056381.1 serine/threonine protein kinase [Gammaproteobacteria bacterium]
MSHPENFQSLKPDLIIDAVESLGLECDARIFPLNSYENRVYQIGLENQDPIIGKFYRPARWSNPQIIEEHIFTQELADLEIPVVAPLSFDGKSLMTHNNFRFALFPRKGGRTPELDNLQHLEWMGRFLGRIHAAGSVKPFKHRPGIDIQSFVIEPGQFLIDNNFIPDYLHDAYQSLSEDILKLLQQHLASVHYDNIRLHGDCHPGNILWTDKGPHFVDFDDCRMGPAIQDLWMLLSGSINDQRKQLNAILDGYYEFHDFNPAEVRLVETLRTLRIIHYSGWLARRWDDATFPLNFPWFNTASYWEQHILELREQFSLLQENEQLSL